MPYGCARAVCATFCHRIAGALIPIFGPSFPSECTPASINSPHCKGMVISQQVILRATEEVEKHRQGQNSGLIKAVGEISSSHRVESYALRCKQESQTTLVPILPSQSRSAWTPVNGSITNSRLMEAPALKMGSDSREANKILVGASRSALPNQAVPSQNPFQKEKATISGQSRTEGNVSERKWGSKRRHKRVFDELNTMHSPNEGERSHQELEHLGVAEVLLSLASDVRDTAYPSSLAVGMPDNDEDFHERHRKRKRPKALLL